MQRGAGEERLGDARVERARIGDAHEAERDRRRARAWLTSAREAARCASRAGSATRGRARAGCAACPIAMPAEPASTRPRTSSGCRSASRSATTAAEGVADDDGRRVEHAPRRGRRRRRASAPDAGSAEEPPWPGSSGTSTRQRSARRRRDGDPVRGGAAEPVEQSHGRALPRLERAQPRASDLAKPAVKPGRKGLSSIVRGDYAYDCYELSGGQRDFEFPPRQWKERLARSAVCRRAFLCPRKEREHGEPSDA